ncbi:MAG: hypothetical protein ACOVOV_00755 [Dolichospermum sp.]
MLDISNIPSQNQQTFTFYATGNWQTWSKPRNAKFIQIFCLGAGGGGGQNNLSNPTGAGGGGSSGIVRGIIPAFLLPDTIYILVGKGGVGSSIVGAGGSGGNSYVAIQPSTSEQTLICKAATGTFSGGGGGTNAPGAAGLISNVALSAYGNLGLFTAVAGVAGAAVSVNGTAGNSLTALASNIITGGASGAGRNASITGVSGGSILAAPSILTTNVSGGTAASLNGESGYGRLQPFCGTGGGGGASVTTGVGGRGGNGWYGCGGGAAGGGTVLTKAGDGGDGLVIITVIT